MPRRAGPAGALRLRFLLKLGKNAPNPLMIAHLMFADEAINLLPDAHMYLSIRRHEPAKLVCGPCVRGMSQERI
jgi:hypothetical protein